MQVAGKEVHAECLAITGQIELHGNALGLSRISSIAEKLIALFSRTCCRFFFTRVDKLHLACTKFADTLLDSGNNRALSLLHYGPRASRLPLALQLIQLLGERDCLDFWGAFLQNDTERFVEVMKRVSCRLEEFHNRGIYHDRTVQLLGDALRWGIEHPKALLEGGVHQLDSPNIVAFTLIIELFHTLFEQTGARVRTFIHDEQNEFARYLVKSYDLLSGFAFRPSSITAPLPNIKKALTFGCDLQIASCTTCIGLQLIDVALWLTKRYYDTDGAIHSEAGALAKFIAQNAVISSFTREQMIEDTEKVVEALNALPLTKLQLEKGRELVEEMEAMRLTRMREPPSESL